MLGDLFESRWRSGNHIGPARPVMQVWLRTGRYNRDYITRDGIGALIPGSSPTRPWTAHWDPLSDWIELEGVLDYADEQDFESNGMTVANLTVENVGLVEAAGLAGAFHFVRRGRLSPWGGYSPPGRPGFPGTGEMFEKLIGNSQIAVTQGYGMETMVVVFNGLIDNVEPTARPDRVRVTARMGKSITDEKLFGHAKDPKLLDPVTFALKTTGVVDNAEGVAYGAKATSTRDGNPAKFAADKNSESSWISQNKSTGAATEWVEVRLPAGRYESFILHPRYEGMEVFVGLFVRGNSKLDGVALPEGFVAMGKGDVPGANGGWPWIAHYGSAQAKQINHKLPGTFVLADDCVLRVAFRNLRKIQNNVYRAGMVRLAGVKRVRHEQVQTSRKWVILDDIADMVRLIFLWSGHPEWEIENVNAKMEGKWVFNRDTRKVDIIKKIMEATNFVLFMSRPLSLDSMGVPVFRAPRMTANMRNVPEILDRETLTGIQLQITEETLPSIFRVRGKRVESGGKTLGGDMAQRLMAVYRPPWAPASRTAGRHAGIIRHFQYPYESGGDDHLSRQQDCEVMARRVALSAAMGSVTANLELSGHPGFALDSQVFVRDEGTGLASRMYVARRSSEFRLGAQSTWKTTLGGALLDTPDVTKVTHDLVEYWRRAPNPVRIAQ